MFRSSREPTNGRAVRTQPPTPGQHADLARGAAALEAVQANVFIADTDLNLVWMNSKATQTLTSLGAAVRSAFGVKINDIVGGSIHRFHRDPQRVERILRGPGGLPHDAEFTFGGITLDTHINAIPGDNGQVAGYVVAWEDVTSRKAAETNAASFAERLGETRDVSAAVQNVASATEEMVSTVNEIARNTAEASATVHAAMGVVEDTTRTMTELGAAAERITGVVDTIGEVASQTNLLALNATIEAARAGELGKGFAVVASEVKELSKQTQTATEDIKKMVSEVQHLVQAGIAAIANIAEVVNRVGANQTAIATSVEQQTLATQEISANLANAAQKAESIAAYIAANS